MDACETVTFDNGRGVRLAGSLHGPLGPLMAISCHGMFASRGGRKHVALAAALAPHGMGLLRFDFAGAGGSQGRLFDLTYSGRMQDLAAAIDYLAGRGVRKVCVFGSSMGGSVALLCAARDERIVRVATLAAVAHPAALLEDHPQAVGAWERQGYFDAPAGRIGRAFLDDSLCHDVEAAVRVLRAPVLIIHGEEDALVPCHEAHDLAAAARRASLTLVPGAGHSFERPQQLRPVLRAVAHFLAHGPAPDGAAGEAA